MQVKVFEASDMTSGLKMVKEALGPDALILSTRTIRKGKLGMMGKAVMEITAAVDSDWNDRSARTATTGRKQGQQVSDTVVKGDTITYEQIWKYRESGTTRNREDREADGRQAQEDRDPIKEEIGELRSLVQVLSRRISGMEQTPGSRTHEEPHAEGTNNRPNDDRVVSLLRRCGVNRTTAEMLSATVRKKMDSGGPESAPLHSLLKREIAALFKVESQILSPRQQGRKRICLVGPTGAGKTTTIAKIAANYLNRCRGKIALITIDTYRIAAVEQLKVYGEIMRLPVEVVIRPSQLEQALNRHRDSDLILIDTAGRSPRNELELQEMTSFFRPELGIEHHLLLSATTREAELEETIHRFGCLPIQNVIFSKIDECGQLGVLLNVHSNNRIPISFLTNGQRVPEDIIIPDPETIAGLIMNDHRIVTNG